MIYDSALVNAVIELALQEDTQYGDITSQACIPSEARAQFAFVNREPLVVAGIDVVKRILHHVDAEVTCDIHHQDGESVEAYTTIISGHGNARSVLRAERIALNFLQHLSGIATLTRAYVVKLEGSKTKLLDTRKTTPGLRVLEKYAVTCGGGYNHRIHLGDGVMIKDNHIAICGSIADAVKCAREAAPALTRIEVECDTLDQVEETLKAQADMIMLDNMSLDDMAKAVQIISGKVLVEASGNVTIDTITDIAHTGVDYISVGRLTHSAPNMDIGLDIVV